MNDNRLAGRKSQNKTADRKETVGVNVLVDSQNSEAVLSRHVGISSPSAVTRTEGVRGQSASGPLCFSAVCPVN